MRAPENFLNQKISKFTPYSLNSDVNPRDIKIRLDANESFLNLPDYIIKDVQAGIKSIDFNRYPDPAARELIIKYIDYLKSSEDIKLDPRNIVAGNGSDELLSIITNLFISKDEKILIFEPDFSMYAFYGQIIEANIVRLRKNNLKIDWREAADLIRRENIKLAVFSNPCNPTGQLESKQDIKKFIDLAAENGTVIILDEVYMSFCGNRESFISDLQDYANLIIIKSLSKSIGLASLRVGFAISNEIFINAIRTIKSPFNLNAVSQKIAEVILNYPDYLAANLDLIRQNKKDLQETVRKILADNQDYLIHETETNFILTESKKSGELFNFMLENKILTRNLNNNYIRVTTGSAEENAEFTACLEKFIKL